MSAGAAPARKIKCDLHAGDWPAAGRTRTDLSQGQAKDQDKDQDQGQDKDQDKGQDRDQDRDQAKD